MEHYSTSGPTGRQPVWTEHAIDTRDEAIASVAAEVWERTEEPRHMAQFAEAELLAQREPTPANIAALATEYEEGFFAAQRQASIVGAALAATEEAHGASLEGWCRAAMDTLGLRELPADERELLSKRARAAFDAMNVG